MMARMGPAQAEVHLFRRNSDVVLVHPEVDGELRGDERARDNGDYIS